MNKRVYQEGEIKHITCKYVYKMFMLKQKIIKNLGMQCWDDLFLYMCDKVKTMLNIHGKINMRINFDETNVIDILTFNVEKDGIINGLYLDEELNKYYIII